MCEFAGNYLSTAHESVVEIWDNSARLSGSDTISGFQQRKRGSEKETEKLVKERFGEPKFLL